MKLKTLRAMVRSGAAHATVSPGETVVLALTVILFLAHVIGILFVERAITNGQIVAGDGLFYYEYLPSIFLDGDLNFENQRATAHALGVPYNWDAEYLGRTNTGLFGNPFPIGWALTTAPFFAVAHSLSLGLSAVGIVGRLDGYGVIDQFVTNLGAVIYGLIGIHLCYRALRQFFSDAVSGIAVIALVLCSSLPYYIVVHASMSHAVAFFCMAWTTLCFVRLVNGASATIPFGLAAGLVLVSRPQLAPVIGLFFLVLLWQRKGDARGIIASAIVCAAIVALQFVVWAIVYGRVLLVPQGDHFLSPLTPHLFDVLFSLNHGFLTWTPFLALGIVGVVLGAAWGQQRVLYVLFFLAVASQVYVNAIAADWWGGNSFGYRRMIEVYPLLMFGVARLMALNRWSLGVVTALAIMCAAFNALFFVQYRFCYIPRGQAITYRQLLIEKLYLYKLQRPYCDEAEPIARAT